MRNIDKLEKYFPDPYIWHNYSINQRVSKLSYNGLKISFSIIRYPRQRYAISMWVSYFDDGSSQDGSDIIRIEYHTTFKKIVDTAHMIISYMALTDGTQSVQELAYNLEKLLK